MSALRLRLNKLQEAKPGVLGKSLLFNTPDRGRGVDRDGTAILQPEPVQFGKELALVKEPLSVCFGRIGTAGVKCCLKSIGKCEVESHERTKCTTVPEDTPFFIQLAGPNRGYANVVLDAYNLDTLLIQKLLEEGGLNWSSEFETMRVQGTRTLEDSELSNNLLRTVKKMSRNDIDKAIDSSESDDVFKTLDDSFARLNVVQEIVTTMAAPELDEDGVKLNSRQVEFEEVSHFRFCEDVYDRIDVLQEHAECVNDCLQVFPVFVKDFGMPLIDMGNGLKLELASLRGNLGTKDLTRQNVPPGLWNAIETGFDSISSLEAKNSIVIGKMEERLGTCEDASLKILELQYPMEAADGKRARSPADSEDEGVWFARETFGNSNTTKRSSGADDKRS